ncbi:nuclease-related domain-containing protein [Pedococcus aerophilus]|uniref:nuclease-related domain-containing protein n=1 Tax=Pedococcus aerophilus TaxID=436356 RepID=UPI0031CF2C04
MEGELDGKVMRLRYAGTCRVCGSRLPEKTRAIYERQTKTVRCLEHVTPPASSMTPKRPSRASAPPAEALPPEAPAAAPEDVDSGVAGASARREFERRKARREERIRTAHPRIGGFLLAISEEKQSTTAWGIGAVGEERLGKGLDRLANDTVRLLHDRRIPKSRANIDHIAVTASGIYVIDAKKYKGRPQLKIEGGVLRPRVERLLVGRRDCTNLVDSVLKQVEAVRIGLADDTVPVHGVLCFVEADWPLFGGSFTTHDVQVVWPKKLYPQLQVDGPLSTDAIDTLHRRLANALPAA